MILAYLLRMTKMSEIKIERVLKGFLIREGAGVKLQRYVGADRSNELEPILLFDYFKSDDPLDFEAGFPPHPHRGFETVTYLLEGQITHEDNHGHKGLIGPGDVQWMTAGKGIIHSEMPSSPNGCLHGLQLWLNLPAAKKMQAPHYQEMAAAELPIEKIIPGLTIKVIAGSTSQGTSSPLVDIATAPLFFDVHLSSGSVFEQKIPPRYQAILLVIAGQLSIADRSLSKDEFAALSADGMLRVKALHDSQFIFIAAKKLEESIVRYGPFVMNNQTEIEQAIADFRSGHF